MLAARCNCRSSSMGERANASAGVGLLRVAQGPWGNLWWGIHVKYRTAEEVAVVRPECTRQQHSMQRHHRRHCAVILHAFVKYSCMMLARHVTSQPRLTGGVALRPPPRMPFSVLHMLRAVCGVPVWK